MIRWAVLLILPLLASCAPPQEAEVAAVEDAPLYRWWLTEDGTVEYENDPYARSDVRRADHDIYVTLVSRDVALVVEPASGAPEGVSNMLASALVRRFAGELPLKEALGAAKLFIIKPFVNGDSMTSSGTLIVDWVLRDEGKRDVGALYATRRLSGFTDGKDPWQASTFDDAEHVALQTAAHLIDTAEVRDAVALAQGTAVLEATPTPQKRPAGG